MDIWSELYNRPMKSLLQDNDTGMYSTHYEIKSVVTERFMRTLKNKIYKYVNSVSDNVYIHQLDDIVNKYNSTYLSTIKMKPADINSSTYKFKVGDHLRISKC